MFIIFQREGAEGGDVYLAFLPLAHVMELLAENVMMLFGIRVGSILELRSCESQLSYHQSGLLLARHDDRRVPEGHEGLPGGRHRPQGGDSTAHVL